MALTIPTFPAAPAPVAVLPTTDRAPVWTTIPTDNNVAFVTIDDGYDNGNDNTALAVQVAAAQLPLTVFLTYYAASSGSYPPSPDPVKVAHVEYLRKFVTGCKRVGSHAKNHISLPTLPSYMDQNSHIQLARTWLGLPGMFGTPPVLFRPPNGAYNPDTLKAAWNNGHLVVLLWSLTSGQIAEGAVVRRGDIILHHFNATLEADLQTTLDAVAAAGLTPAWLEDYVRYT